MANSVDPDQLPSDLNLHCLQRQSVSWFSRTRVKVDFLKKNPSFKIAMSVQAGSGWASGVVPG